MGETIKAMSLCIPISQLYQNPRIEHAECLRLVLLLVLNKALQIRLCIQETTHHFAVNAAAFSLYLHVVSTSTTTYTRVPSAGTMA